MGKMVLVKHETCVEYFRRRIKEGWKCISLEGYKAVLLSPEGIRRELDLRNDIETLRPNEAGDETSISYQYPSTGEHWDKVDEVSSDEHNTSVRNARDTLWRRDLYKLPASSGSGKINFIKVYFRVYGAPGELSKASIKSNSTVTDGDAATSVNYTWETFSQQWNTNPAPPGTDDWTWDDIDTLQIGVSLKGVEDYYGHRCTQVYVEIDSSPATAPAVTTQAASSIEATTATGNGNITDTGGENCHTRGICYMEGDSGDPTTANDKVYDNGAGSYGTGSFSKGITGLTHSTNYRARAYAINSAGTGYGATVGFTTKAIHYGSATLSGIGSLAGIGSFLWFGKATLSGSGLLSAIGQVFKLGSAVLTGVGNLAVSAIEIFAGKVTLTGIGSLVAKAAGIFTGKAILTGTGTLVAKGVRIFTGKATLIGIGTLATIGSFLRYATVTLSGTGSVIVSAVTTLIGKATLAGTGTLSAIGSFLRYGVATLSGVGSLATKGVGIFIAKVTLSGTGALSAIGSFWLFAKATLTGIGSLSAIGRGIYGGVATLVGQGSLAVKAAGIFAGKAILTGIGTLSAIGTKFFKNIFASIKTSNQT